MFNRSDQRGFIFLELAIGLPLIIMLLWAMTSLLANTWGACRNLIADFTLQMEVSNAMRRIVDDMRSARSAEKVTADKTSKLKLTHWYTTATKIVHSAEDDGELNDPDSDTQSLPIYYFMSSTSSDNTVKNRRYKIYRQRREYAKNHPITGEDILSDVNITKFVYAPLLDPSNRLWNITIEAESKVSGHKFSLTTTVFLEGVD